MANEILFSFQTNKTCYVIMFNRISQVWNVSSGAFENYNSANYGSYALSATQLGTASPFFTASFPANIPPGDYQFAARQQIGGSVAESDPTVDAGSYPWNGSYSIPLSDLATSGQVGQIAPIRLARGWMIQNYPIYLKSSADHVTPLTSGVISGQIARDGGSFGPLQSGAFTEVGLGWYNLQALTSGDLNANTIKLLFTAVTISGGVASDPLPQAYLTQRTSGF